MWLFPGSAACPSHTGELTCLPPNTYAHTQVCACAPPGQHLQALGPGVLPVGTEHPGGDHLLSAGEALLWAEAEHRRRGDPSPCSGEALCALKTRPPLTHRVLIAQEVRAAQPGQGD